MNLWAGAPGRALHGDLRPPGDKSISHRALILGGLARGESRIRGLLESADTRATLSAMEQLGARFSRGSDELRVEGVGGDGLRQPGAVLDMGNSGTAMRLLTGVLAAQDFTSELSGDASLNRRPMDRIIRPLEAMGADIQAQSGGTAPLRIVGNPRLSGIHYDSPVASAQVKSCLLLAGLFARGRTSVSEPRPSRDHTERMLPLFGVAVDECGVEGGSELRATRLQVPADPSSAAFLAAAALLVPGSDLVLRGVGINPTRAAFYDVLRAMGADLRFEPVRGGSPAEPFEPVADIRVRYSGPLQGVEVPVDSVPALIDEVPVLVAVAACAQGVTRIRGAAELRVKESDRLAVMAAGLAAMGIRVREHADGIDVHGGQPRSARVDAAADHRCAMSFAVLGQVVGEGVEVAGASHIDTSYPGFASQLRDIGGVVREAEAGS